MKKTTLITLISVASVLSACSSTPKSSEPATSKQETNKPSLAFQYLDEAKVIIDDLQGRVNDDKNKDLNYFAPRALKRAKSYLAEAIEEHTDAVNGDFSMLSVFQSDEEKAKDTKDEVSQLVKKATAAFEEAQLIRTRANTILGDAFALRNYLKSINASKYYSREYAKLNEQIDRLVVKIASGDENRAVREQPALVANLKKLEVDTMLHIKLSSINKKISTLDRNSADKLLPSVFRQLTQARDTATVTIKTTPREMGLIDDAVASTQFQLDRLNVLLAARQQLKTLRSSNYEQFLLQRENQLYRISQALNGSDHRNQTYAQQTASIIEALTTLSNKVSALSGTLSDNEQAQADAASENAKLKNEIEVLNQTIQTLESQITVLKETISDTAVKASSMLTTESAVNTPVIPSTTDNTAPATTQESVQETLNANSDEGDINGAVSSQTVNDDVATQSSEETSDAENNE